jgi:hypothetical protein
MVRILKEYETKLNVGAADLYTGNFSDERYLLDYLKIKFEGKCMDSSFVSSIKNILARSMITIDKSDLSGGGYLHVRFSAEAIVHTAGSILVGCEVMTVEREGMIMCRHDHAMIHIKGNKNFSPNKGDLIIVRVKKIGYPVDSRSMSIAAIPYYIPHDFNIKIVRPSSIGPVEQDLLQRKLAELDAVKKLYDAADKETISFFEDLFYPYQTKAYEIKPIHGRDIKRGAIVLKTKHSAWNITELAESALSAASSKLPIGETVALSRHSAIPKQSPSVLVLKPDVVRNIKTDADPFNDGTKFSISVVLANYAVTLEEYLNDYCEYLSVLVECANVYNTEKIRKAHSRLWTVYTLMKR